MKKPVFRSAIGIISPNDFKGHEKRSKLKHFPYLISFAYMLEWFSQHLSKKGIIGEVVADSRRTADKLLIDVMDFAIRPECKIKDSAKPLLKEKCSAIRFATKRYLSGRLELTDFISYATYFKVRNALRQNKHLGMTKVWSTIKRKLYDQTIDILTKNEIQRYFNVRSNRVHEYLKIPLKHS